jgi:dTDP-glucose pyrophosphorylase
MMVSTGFHQLVARVRGLEHRSQRAEEDITSIIDTVVETGEDVKVLKRDVKWLKREVHETRTDVAQLKHATLENRKDIQMLKSNVGILKTDVGSLKTGIDWLKRATQALLDHNGVQIGDAIGAVEHDD